MRTRRPGLWIARQARISLVGVDFSPIAVEQAALRAAAFGLAGQARFVIGDLSRTGLPDTSVDAAVSIDAFHFAAEAHRILRSRRRLVLTS